MFHFSEKENRANFIWEHFAVFNLIRIKLRKNNAPV